MIELISYWKLACPKKVYITPFRLSEEQIKWWKKLYFNGLGEFFYLNGIKENVDDFMEIVCESDISLNKINIPLSDATLVPVGGGKDSVVTLELLKNKLPVIPLIINPRGATNECVKVAGFSDEQVAVVKRTLDPTMLRMNNEGFLNGHTPFSAMLAFYTLLIGFATNSKYIALSNESSANEPTVPDSEINHQYSKSIAFENDFRDYVNKYIAEQCVNYKIDNIDNIDWKYLINNVTINEQFLDKLYFHINMRDYCQYGDVIWKLIADCDMCVFHYLFLNQKTNCIN